MALIETEQGLTSIRYAALVLGDLDPETMRFTPNLRWVADDDALRQLQLTHYPV